VSTQTQTLDRTLFLAAVEAAVPVPSLHNTQPGASGYATARCPTTSAAHPMMSVDVDQKPGDAPGHNPRSRIRRVVEPAVWLVGSCMPQR
jgi:hypothetical protein